MKIKSKQIKYYDSPIPVYDITVDTYHNFFANGILVHNCAHFNHGNASLDETINNMVATYKNNETLLLGEGAFGSRILPEAAASRYTYVRTHNKVIDKYFQDNDILLYSEDPEQPEPLYYLPIIPWVLVNGVSGIAVGFATEILPRDPIALARACEMYTLGKDIDSLEIAPYFAYYAGSIIKNGDGWICRGNITINSPTMVTISEVPIGYDREKYVVVLDDLQDKGEIVSYKDKCGKEGFLFEVTLKRNNKNLSVMDLIKMFKLEKKLSENITIIDQNNSVRVYNNVNQVIKDFCDHRLSFYSIRYQYYIDRDTEKLSKVDALIKFIELFNSGKISILGKSKKVLLEELERYPELKGHSEYLVDIQIHRLCEDSLNKLKQESEALQSQISKWKSVDFKKQFISELKSLK